MSTTTKTAGPRAWLRRAVLALAVVTTTGSLVATAPTTASADPPATFHEGACAGSEGVTMVVDFGYIAPAGKEEPIVRCALGPQATGWAAIENAGIEIGSVPGFEGAAICQLEGVPAEGFPYCWLDEGYWSYWHAEPGQAWTYSQYGAAGRTPEAGTVDGWRFVPLAGAGVPPRVGPTFVPGVDVTAPVIAFTGEPTSPVAEDAPVTVTWTVDDLGAQQECRLDKGTWVPCDQPTTWDATQQSHTFTGVAPGRHTIQVRATDAWGNATTIRSARFVVSGDAPVVAPTLDLSVSATQVGVGDEVTLTWSATDADTVTGSGAWSGAKDPDDGTETVTVDSAGTATFTLTAVGPGGTVTTEQTVEVSALPTPIKVAGGPRAVTGQRSQARVTGLMPGESYQVRLADRVVAQGTAPATLAGPVTVVALTVPRTLREGRHPLTVIGGSADRVATAPVEVLSATKRLTVEPARAAVRRTGVLRLRVTGLAAGEKVTVRVGGRVVRLLAVKEVAGRTQVRVRVPRALGAQKVVVRGTTATRRGTATVRVTR